MPVCLLQRRPTGRSQSSPVPYRSLGLLHDSLPLTGSWGGRGAPHQSRSCCWVGGKGTHIHCSRQPLFFLSATSPFNLGMNSSFSPFYQSIKKISFSVKGTFMPATRRSQEPTVSHRNHNSTWLHGAKRKYSQVPGIIM